MRIVPTTLREANAFVAERHRHHKPTQGHKFSIGAANDNGDLIGVVIVGRPVARMADDGLTAEVTRLCTDGTPNACSMLYGAAARAAQSMGFRRVQTYILDEEPGTSLKASGWVHEATTSGGDWNRPSRNGRRTDQPPVPKQRWSSRLSA
jgi:hypothetical protein